MMNILTAVDFSPVTEQVLQTLEQIAAKSAAQVWLVHRFCSCLRNAPLEITMH